MNRHRDRLGPTRAYVPSEFTSSSGSLFGGSRSGAASDNNSHASSARSLADSVTSSSGGGGGGVSTLPAALASPLSPQSAWMRAQSRLSSPPHADFPGSVPLSSSSTATSAASSAR